MEVIKNYVDESLTASTNTETATPGKVNKA